MRFSEVQQGRSFTLILEDGEDFYSSIIRFCSEQGIRQGYIPMFLAGMRNARVVGTCDKLEDPAAPVWSSVYVENVEAIGCGTIATDRKTGEPSLHIHVSVGKKAASAAAYTSHLLSAEIQFLAEIIVVEVASPVMHRVKNRELYDVPLLHFEES